MGSSATVVWFKVLKAGTAGIRERGELFYSSELKNALII